MSALTDSLTLFDRINIAKCASTRAQQAVLDADRFTGEFQTARMWVRYRCNIGPNNTSFVESN
jgi:hypothetical protein